MFDDLYPFTKELIMDTSFWHNIWQRGEIGFHRAAAHPALVQHWSALSRPGAPVLVPLCGKTPDLHWLHQQGHPVTGVELSAIAVEAFFQEWGLAPHKDKTHDGLDSFSGENITLLQGDFFQLAPQQGFPLFYDRAALVALDHPLRQRYLAHLAHCLAPGAEGILITFEFDAASMDGPPFPVFEKELHDQPFFAVRCLARNEVTDSHGGLVARGAEKVVEAVYHLVKE
ncbi:MAG: thiopurine S-methyltransferase [Halomonadaceae bacterium]|nr:MAG: thiopurine S-methyltransferase [Halomonadaceae bacterium]